MNKKASLLDIAKLAGVSTATVSYALNGSNEVSEKTRLKITKIAKELNYHPNKAAQGLRTRQSKLICMLINTFNSIFNGELVDDIREKLSNYGYSLVVIGDSSADLIDSQLFDALIIFNYSASKKTLTNLVQHTSIPIVIMANELDANNVENIVIDNRSAINHLFKYFERSPHQNICFFTNNKSSYNATIRLQECIDYMARHHSSIDVHEHLFNGKFELKSAYNIALKLLSTTKYNFFFCLNDMMAYGIYQAATELGLEIGKDISIVGFDNSPKSGELYKPKLTTVDSRLNTWSQEIVNSIIDRLNTDAILVNKTIYTPTRIIHGDSVNSDK